MKNLLRIALPVFLIAMLLNGCGSSKYDDAVSQMDQGNYQTALEILNGITNNENTADKIKECKYALGNEAITAEDWDTAISYFTDLDYKDSGELLALCTTKKGMNENSDYEFLAALEASVLDRIDSVSNTNYDSATVVNTELFYVEKYGDSTFYDANLKALAEKYIEGLKIQKEALKKENEYEIQIEWQRGLVYRYEVLRDLYEQYNFLESNKDFVATYVSACDDQRALLDAYDALEADIGAQTTAEDFTWWLDGHEFYCTIKNNTQYRFSTTFDISFIDADGVIFEESSTYIENITAGSSYKVSFYISHPEQLDSFMWSNYYDDVVY